jgi:hypothetical protein
MSLSNGNIEAQKTLLDMYNCSDGTVFLFGGIQQETHKTKDSLEKNIGELLNKTFAKYPNSKVIFWNTVARSDHPYIKTQNLAIDVKNTFVNNLNVFEYTFRTEDENYNDQSHYKREYMEKMIVELTDFIFNSVEKLIANRFDKVVPKNKMEFNINKSVTFILNYPPVKETVFINCKNFDDHESTFEILVGKHAQGDGRPHIFKHPRLKSITFSNNVLPILCMVENY